MINSWGLTNKVKSPFCLLTTTAHNSMFALWPGDVLTSSNFYYTVLFRGQDSVWETGHIANTNVSGNGRATPLNLTDTRHRNN